MDSVGLSVGKMGNFQIYGLLPLPLTTTTEQGKNTKKRNKGHFKLEHCSSESQGKVSLVAGEMTAFYLMFYYQGLINQKTLSLPLKLSQGLVRSRPVKVSGDLFTWSSL